MLLFKPLNYIYNSTQQKSMTIQEKVEAVDKVFKKLDEQIAELQSWSGLHCKWGCGKCCFKPDIESTIFIFIKTSWPSSGYVNYKPLILPSA
jgi:hypothetical protein